MKLSGRRTWPLIAGLAAALAITTTAASAATSGHAAQRTIPKCTASELGVWVAADEGNGTAGSIYYPLEFTNISSQTCYMYGFPGVSTTNSSGRQLGSSASWNHQVKPAIVNLAPGATAHSILQYEVVAVSPQCKQAPASMIKVYPPDQTSSATGFWDFESCTTAKPVYLSVEAIQPGTGPRI
ncbi:MAG TPA: DUF4232 domain-containing protein [Streptosporangiaceae bacterium]|jgi:hypothetical protein|nr:DUF4232 domain-containing protein [Streptosporangiaceae bacterium]